MRLSSLTISTGFHAAVILAAMVGLPWVKKDLVIPAPLMVEFVEIGKVTETTKVAPPAPKPDKQEEKKEEPPPPAPKNTAKEATPPAPKKPEPAPKKEEPKKDSKPEVDPIAKPDKKPPPKKDEKKETAKPKEPERDFNSLLKNLADPKRTPPSAADQPDMGLKTATPVEGAQAPLGQKMTMREEDALRSQLERCWNVPFGAKDAQDLNVEIFMVINPDRTLRDARVVDMARYNRDTFFRAAADSALRAVRNPLCSPFALPADKYDVWKTTTVNFNPREMF
jgi:outer membrane biosynthesis protein TonB